MYRKKISSVKQASYDASLLFLLPRPSGSHPGTAGRPFSARSLRCSVHRKFPLPGGPRDSLCSPLTRRAVTAVDRATAAQTTVQKSFILPSNERYWLSRRVFMACFSLEDHRIYDPTHVPKLQYACATIAGDL